MFVTNGPNAIAHADADCHCSSCKQSLKPDKIVALPSAIRRSAGILKSAAIAKTNAAISSQAGGNVISLSAVIKAAGQARRRKAEKAKFNYPMLECS